MKTSAYDVGVRLYAIRAVVGKSQEEMAKAVQAETKEWSHWELARDNRTPRREVLAHIWRTWHIPLPYIEWGETDDMPEDLTAALHEVERSVRAIDKSGEQRPRVHTAWERLGIGKRIGLV